MIEQIFILTKEGRKYNEEGKQHVINAVSDMFGLAETYHLTEGAILNNAEYLGQEAAKYIGGDTGESCRCCFVISESDGIGLLGGTRHNIEGFIADAGEHPGMSSWEIIHEELKLLDNRT